MKVQKTKVPGVTVSTIDKDIVIPDLTDDVAISVFDGWCHDCVVLCCSTCRCCLSYSFPGKMNECISKAPSSISVFQYFVLYFLLGHARNAEQRISVFKMSLIRDCDCDGETGASHQSVSFCASLSLVIFVAAVGILETASADCEWHTSIVDHCSSAIDS
mmetsp:Transcript_32094/g.75478  ORF Transcript_32094/g.75478 Transcript_32094/m.75478 type:complete len:160 (-) Transcript_32094:5-484(-)